MARYHESDYRAIFLYTIFMLNIDNVISQIQNSKCTLFILCGFPYAGKSHLADKILKETDVVLVSIDTIFKAKGFDWDTNVLPSSHEWQQIFNESYEKTTAALEQGKNVLYDSTNQTFESREALRDVADRVGTDTYVLYIHVPVETVWQRWEENRNNPNRSIVSKELVEMTINMFEAPTDKENVLLINNNNS